MSAAWLAIPAAVAAFGAAYQWLGAVLVARWLREAAQLLPERELPPVTLLRPLKGGVPDLRGKLERLARALRPGDRLVLGAALGSPELVECERLARTFAEREIAVVPCREGAAVNPKISKLVQMDAACRHERLILSDSESMIDAAWLAALRREWEQSGADALTTGYRFAGAMTWPQRLDAAPALLSLWPGLALMRRFGRVNFTLGACTALRRRDLEDAGGWRAFGDFLAEDRELGAALTARGRTIRLAALVTTLDTDPLGWRDWWRHQRRVAATYRAAAPVGFAGMALTHSATAALLLVGLSIGSGWEGWALLWAGGMLTLRWLAARRLAAALDFPAQGLAASLLVAGPVESLAWLAAWGRGAIWWSGRRWRLRERGKLTPEPP